MAEYEIELEVTGRCSVVVQADSFKEALETNGAINHWALVAGEKGITFADIAIWGVESIKPVKVEAYDEKLDQHRVLMNLDEEREYEKANSIQISWHIDDVKATAEQMDIAKTDEDAREILEIVERRHDANLGISWDVIEAHIDQHMNPYKPEDKEN